MLEVVEHDERAPVRDLIDVRDSDGARDSRSDELG
jgi:hypothetical protein